MRSFAGRDILSLKEFERNESSRSLTSRRRWKSSPAPVATSTCSRKSP